jgi:4-coumarate--CoA ligase (photoactive yellow protein activation family)
LSFRRIEEWVLQIFRAREKNNLAICFQTSGTTGAAKSVRHSMVLMEREINFLTQHFKQVRTIIPFVPSYTIYGFLFTVWLPEKLKAIVTYPSDINWTKESQSSLIVASPFQWQWLLKSMPTNSVSFLGVSSSAPLYKDLFQTILNKGILLTEIYGSTETLGVAFRQHWEDPFTLFPYWQLMKDGPDSTIQDRESQQVIPLMDMVKQYSSDNFTLIGRKDKQVKIAGMLVDTDHITTVINGFPNVSACMVSAKFVGVEVLIQAAITLQNDGNDERASIENQLKQQLTAPEMPRIIHFDLP